MRLLRKTTVEVFKWIVYIVLLFVFFIVQTSVPVLAVFDVRPVLVVAFVVAVSMQERETYAMAFGILAGFMWDFSSGKVPGFNAIILMLCCIVISLATMYFMGNNPVNSMLFCALTMVLQGLFDYLFYYVIWGYADSYLVLLRYILPTALYTTVVTPLLFLLVRWIHNKLESRMEQ